MMTMTPTTGTTDLADVLRRLGVDVIRAGEKEISARCPVHLKRTGKEDKSPSWSMNGNTGLWICYSCGARGTLSQLVSEITGETDSIVAIHKFLITNSLNRISTPKVEEKAVPIDWFTFSKFSVPSDARLQEKNLDREAVRRYGIRWDTSTQSWIIPIVAPTGELMGWQSKSKSRVLNYPTGVSKSKTLFGLDSINSGTCVLVESPLDVVRLSTVMDGVCGLASFGAHISKSQIALLSLYVNKLVVALDNDEAGINAAKKLKLSLPSFKNPVTWLRYRHTSVKDLGDMTDSEIYEAVTGASVLPWWIPSV